MCPKKPLANSFPPKSSSPASSSLASSSPAIGSGGGSSDVRASGLKPATVFLDRDGTINIDSGYVTTPSQVELIPGAASALGTMARAGFHLVVVSNQSAVGRGMATAADVDATNKQLLSMLGSEDPDAPPELILYCPHRPDDSCRCRKPDTGLVDNAGWNFDPERSWVFGDKLSDIRFGLNLGLPLAQCVLVLTGEGHKSRQAAQSELPGLRTVADIVAGSVLLKGSRGTPKAD